MEPIKLGDLLQGIAVSGLAETVIREIVTDSRKATPGCLYVAIVGDRFDGNDFTAEALEKGALAAVVSRRDNQVQGEQILVPDTRDALVAMAGNYRNRYSPLIAAVTGSVGKTTTKEMLAAIFNSFGRTLKSLGNHNNEIGLPRTVFELDAATELAIFEMGMDSLGSISKMSRAVRPQVSVITTIGVSHIEQLGSRENILKAKLEILDGMPGDGILALNGDDELLMGARALISLKTVTFGLANPHSDVLGKEIISRMRSTEFVIEDREYGVLQARIPCAGLHSVLDALGAYTVATRLGLNPEQCAATLENYRPAGMRQNIVDFMGITVIEDCYNASPDSMYAALATLTGLPVDGLKIAVLGDMLALGPISASAHREVGAEAARQGVDILLCYGEHSLETVEAARAAGITSAEHFAEKRELADYLRKTVQHGDAVLFKASRAIALEDVIEMLYEI